MTCWMIPSGQEAPPVIRMRLGGGARWAGQSGRGSVQPTCRGAALGGKDVVLDLGAGTDGRFALDEESLLAQALGAKAVELVGVGGVLPPDDKCGVERFVQRSSQRVLIHLGGVTESVVSAAAADPGGLPGRRRGRISAA